MTVDVPDGLRCGNVYYGPVIPTRDVYSWDAVTLRGTLQSSFATGCDNSPAGLSPILQPGPLLRFQPARAVVRRAISARNTTKQADAHADLGQVAIGPRRARRTPPPPRLR